MFKTMLLYLSNHICDLCPAKISVQFMFSCSLTHNTADLNRLKDSFALKQWITMLLSICFFSGSFWAAISAIWWEQERCTIQFSLSPTWRCDVTCKPSMAWLLYKMSPRLLTTLKWPFLKQVRRLNWYRSPPNRANVMQAWASSETSSMIYRHIFVI